MNSRLVFLLIILFGSCTPNIRKVQIFSPHGKYIGDSIFYKGDISRIIYIDKYIYIDSTVYFYYENSSNVSHIKSYHKDQEIFEEIEYYKSGHIKNYIFRDHINDKYGYSRSYNERGELTAIKGSPFYINLADNINPKNLEVIIDSPVRFQIFHPSPPDASVELYVLLNNKKYFIFNRSKIIPFLQSVVKENHEKEHVVLDIWIQIKEKDGRVDSAHSSIGFYVVYPH